MQTQKVQTDTMLVRPSVARELYRKITRTKTLYRKVKCGALRTRCYNLINGEKCNYRFRKGQLQCPVCGTERLRCKNWSLRNANKCKFHGGAAGRNIKIARIIDV